MVAYSCFKNFYQNKLEKNLFNTNYVIKLKKLLLIHISLEIINIWYD